MAAWKGSIPWAISEAIIPASTSPLPAVAMPGLPVMFTMRERPGAAITV